MKLILIDGGPASGKNTLGTLLVQKFTEPSDEFILLDLDVYVERINPSWTWDDKQTEKTDQQKAREDFALAACRRAKKHDTNFTNFTNSHEKFFQN